MLAWEPDFVHQNAASMAASDDQCLTDCVAQPLSYLAGEKQLEKECAPQLFSSIEPHNAPATRSELR